MDFRDRAQMITMTGKRMDQTGCSSFGLVETSSCSYSSSGCMSSEEEEDMANCLIMLAYSDKQPAENNNKLKVHNYECKTCNRSFPSFQALGGHRASHKKPKLTITENNNFGSISKTEDGHHQPEFQLQCYEENKSTISNNNNVNNKKGKIHECSICGSEFVSGQALGGHMRRHRAPLPSTSTEKSHVRLSIDLNLPAPEVVDDVHFTATTSSQRRPLIFSTVALVDCHY